MFTVSKPCRRDGYLVSKNVYYVDITDHRLNKGATATIPYREGKAERTILRQKFKWKTSSKGVLSTQVWRFRRIKIIKTTSRRRTSSIVTVGGTPSRWNTLRRHRPPRHPDPSFLWLRLYFYFPLNGSSMDPIIGIGLTYTRISTERSFFLGTTTISYTGNTE